MAMTPKEIRPDEGPPAGSMQGDYFNKGAGPPCCPKCGGDLKKHKDGCSVPEETLAEGITAVRLREAIEELVARSVDSREDFETVVAPQLENLLSLPPSKAEEEIATIRLHLEMAANQISWSHDMLGKNLNGDEMASVRLSLREALDFVQSCRGRGL